jgi:hypothetical protein
MSDESEIVTSRKFLEAIAKEPVGVCEWCGERLTDEEIEYPIPEGPICEECYHEHYEFTCCWCENYEDKDYEEKYVVLTEPTEGLHSELPPGVYEVVKRPYFRGDWIVESALRRIGDVPPEFPEIEDSDGMLCRTCEERITKCFAS